MVGWLEASGSGSRLEDPVGTLSRAGIRSREAPWLARHFERDKGRRRSGCRATTCAQRPELRSTTRPQDDSRHPNATLILLELLTVDPVPRTRRIAKRVGLGVLAVVLGVTGCSAIYNATTSAHEQSARALAPSGRFVEAGGVLTHYERFGTHGSPIVLVGGFLEPSDTWDGVTRVPRREAPRFRHGPGGVRLLRAQRALPAGRLAAPARRVHARRRRLACAARRPLAGRGRRRGRGARAPRPARAASCSSTATRSPAAGPASCAT